MYEVSKIRKCTERPQIELHLTVKSTLYTLYTYPWGPNFAPFRSTISRFWDRTCTKSVKFGNAPNDPKLNLNTYQSKVLYIHLILPQEVQTLVSFALQLAVSEIQHVQGGHKSEVHRMTLNWTWTLNSQKYSIYTKYSPQRPKFWSVLLYDYPFSRYNMYKAGENQKCTEWPQTELEHLIVKSTLYTLHIYPWGPNFDPFRSTISRFWDRTCTRSVNIGNALNDPKLNLNT